MSKQTILVVDDEQDLLDLIEYNLRQEGYNVLKAENGADGIQMAKEHMPDLVLLDIMMPQMDGIEVCDRMREDSTLSHIPIIFLTARSDEKTEIEGLNKGADDFITKPISTTKLVSRIKAVLRRFEETEEKVQKLSVHDLEIDKDRYIVTRGDEEFQLPRKEFELLYYLASKRGKVRDRQTLLNKVWGDNIYVVDRTVDVHVRKIREKLGDHYIETVKGVGYRFKE
ncbi:MAG: response regulator [Bacteroidetes bacterium]|uniref:Response regulator transcription factor n=1 Tax=Rhodohalobacter sulfatireducens TaxID=2911366 RepID=A0ABS9K8L2_9BACT|nr:response regulator transcription factor [Rhodohalobacter sulfatireducens]MDR9367164.1 response regulator transcription factor [Balneolaceae bacterium]NBC04204.1 response regulator [Bacteroidota bacterium]MCG2587194.1 response regulator transcription factor [Rhodohalobacter sulfatireducens]MDR9408630.1 response regulator transcription factor [Balneolaceae bacterium]NBC66395.1 response regulator [Bacteroidota bacterium]